MARELRVEGLGLDAVRRLEPGRPDLVLGRDRYFAEAYLRESLRIRRETVQRQR